MAEHKQSVFVICLTVLMSHCPHVSLSSCITVTVTTQASVETLREQVKLLRSQRQRSVVLAHLPALRPQAQTYPHSAAGAHKCAALEVARRLQLEPAHTPKVQLHVKF